MDIIFSIDNAEIEKKKKKKNKKQNMIYFFFVFVHHLFCFLCIVMKGIYSSIILYV